MANRNGQEISCSGRSARDSPWLVTEYGWPVDLASFVSLTRLGHILVANQETYSDEDEKGLGTRAWMLVPHAELEVPQVSSADIVSATRRTFEVYTHKLPRSVDICI